ncbi:hypothetical protein [Novacetimonas hansenii]|uniref:Uncharacterized protein n=1 Tax=Novacetimonas hansenii ATCC 23769 TaxID=714995 RepID=D5QGI4_NOVHA|nr:hypothetical protein [Novacetimonas hansenii]EFG83840.1 hypothetical protein GXY_11279 [Novacetimonas hansenii ATCC 23769]
MIFLKQSEKRRARALVQETAYKSGAGQEVISNDDVSKPSAMQA